LAPERAGFAAPAVGKAWIHVWRRTLQFGHVKNVWLNRKIRTLRVRSPGIRIRAAIRRYA